MKDREPLELRFQTLEEKLLSGATISGQTSEDRVAIFMEAAGIAGFGITILPAGNELKSAVDPKYEQEEMPIDKIDIHAKPYIKTGTVGEGNFGYYIERSESAKNHMPFWDAIDSVTSQA